MNGHGTALSCSSPGCCPIHDAAASLRPLRHPVMGEGWPPNKYSRWRTGGSIFTCHSHGQLLRPVLCRARGDGVPGHHRTCNVASTFAPAPSSSQTSLTTTSSQTSPQLRTSRNVLPRPHLLRRPPLHKRHCNPQRGPFPRTKCVPLLVSSPLAIADGSFSLGKQLALVSTSTYFLLCYPP